MFIHHQTKTWRTYLLLLPLVAALVGLAAFLAPAPEPVEAQSSAVWSATLTPGAWTGGTSANTGCANARSSSECTALLTDNSINIGGATYTIKTLLYLDENNPSDSDYLRIDWDQNIPWAGLQTYTLRVGGASLPLNSCHYESSTKRLDCVDRDFEIDFQQEVKFTDGEQVRLSLHPPSDIAAFRWTLTAQDMSNSYFGCNNNSTDLAKRCNGKPTPTSFGLGGSGYSITKLEINKNDNQIQIDFNQTIPAALRDYMLSVDGYTLAFTLPRASSYTWGPWDPVTVNGVSKSRMPFNWGENSQVKIKFVKKNPPAPVTEATPLRILTASKSSVREGDPAIVITATLARPAEEDRVILIVHDSNPRNRAVPHGLKLAKYAGTSCTPLSADKDYILSPANINIPAGSKTGTALLAVCDDNTEDSGEFVYLTPDLKFRPIPEAFPESGSGVYQVESLKITILNDETGPDNVREPVPPSQEPIQEPVQESVEEPAEESVEEPTEEPDAPEYQPANSGGSGTPEDSGTHVVRYVDSDALLSFDRGQVTPGQTITVKGSGFTGWTPLQSITIGGVEAFPGGWIITDPDGKFETDVTVPGLSAGRQEVVVKVGGWTASSYLIVSADEVITDPARVFASMGAFLDAVWHFDAPTSTWQFYDPEFPAYSTLAEMEKGEVYLVRVKSSMVAILNGKSRDLTCANGNCWNQIVW